MTALPRLLRIALSLWAVSGGGLAVQAEEWMFRRSYFSHGSPEGLPPDYPLPVSRSAYRTAYYPQGFGVSAAYRINNYVIQNGNRVDRTIYTEGWFHFLPQGD